MLNLRSAVTTALLALAAACGSDTGTSTDPGTKPPPTASVATVDVTPPTTEVIAGHTAKLSATPRDAAGNALSGRTVSWSSSNANIASVDNNGMVTGVATGNTTITAWSEGKSATAAITVKADAPPVAVASVSIAAAPDTIEAWDPATMHALTRDAKDSLLTDRAIRWATSNPAVAIIDSVTGVLTGIDRGTITVTATSEGKIGTQSHVIVIKYRSVSAGTMHACDIASGGIAWCWGLNGSEGRIGSDQLSSSSMSSVPVKVPGNLRFTQLATFGRHTCALAGEGRAYCWGYNGWGALGGNTTVSQSFTPVAVAGTLTFRSITAGSDHACAVTTAGVAYCWGNNDWRQLGTGTSATASSPVAVAGGTAFASIVAGSGFTCGVAASNAAAYCWGANSIGQTGDGQKINYGNVFVSTPQQVVGGLSFKSVSLGNQYACGVSLTGQGYCWGSNSTKLGAGPVNDSSSPVAVTGGYTFQSISAGALHACGVTTSNAVYCWGRNSNGELGVAPANGSSASDIPVRAGGNFTASEVSAAGTGTGSSGHTCAISVDRLTAYCFGRNDVGQLGNGTTAAASTANATPAIIVGQKPL
jgi:alpha-tubulin suppressor-like RCC1 family protein